jgi:hypothetical protein
MPEPGRQDAALTSSCRLQGDTPFMQGKLIVTKDVDAYLKANPAAK